MIWSSVCAAVLTRFLAPRGAARQSGHRDADAARRHRARHILADVVTALRVGVGLLEALRRGLTYLLVHARRAHPERDRRAGRLRAGPTLVEPA